MSRRVSRIQAMITATVRIAPAMTRTMLVVTPTRPTVMPTVSSSGWMHGRSRRRDHQHRPRHRGRDDEDDAGGHADETDRDAHREQQRLDAAAGEVDLLAGGRDVGVERAHEM